MYYERNFLRFARVLIAIPNSIKRYEGLNLAEQVAIQNLDTEKFSEISAEAQKQTDFINGSIENLRLSLELTDDPARDPADT